MKIRWSCLGALVGASLLLAVPSVFAATEADVETRIYDFPVLDFPYNNGRAPSMKQSMQMSNDFNYFVHNAWLDMVAEQGMHDWASQELPIYLFDFIAGSWPLGQGWLHEEWHRAVLGRRGIDSYNGIYDFSSSSMVSVSRVQDAALIALKREHPQELVRAHAAGFESQYEQNLEFEKHAFFNQHSPVMGAQLWLNHLGNILYMDMCASTMSNTETDLANQQEGANVARRDFTGFDCTAWTYDLFRPNEAYAARGVHPSGVGVDRYIKFSDLTTDEQRYLTRQRNLSLLNLMDPFLFGLNQFETPSGKGYWNANLRHELTPFGYDIAANVFLKSSEGAAIFGALHTYRNDKATSLGVDVTLPRYATRWFDKPVHITPRVFAWMQPDNLMFRDTSTKLGGLASVRVDVPIEEGWEIYGELESKSKGWAAGNEYLDSKLAVRLGLTKVIETQSRWKKVAPVAEQTAVPQ
ncbi:MAG: hypothetical protein ABL906_11560 [Sideroxydans sp.]